MTPELEAVVTAAKALLRVGDLHLDNLLEKHDLRQALIAWERTLPAK